MKRGEEFSLQDSIVSRISELKYLIGVLGKHIERFEKAYQKRDYVEFNKLKKEVLDLQRKIHGMIG